MDFKKLEQLMELMRKHAVHKVTLGEGADKISVTSTPPGAPTANFAPVAPAYPVPPAPPAMSTEIPAPPEFAGDANAPKKKTSGKEIRSPFVGTFYRAPAPGADMFVSEGQRVKKGDVLCIVEAMKLMNEIEAEFNGVIKEILVDNEEPVEFDQPLFIVE